MSWLIVGIIPPFLWAVVNHIDKYLLSKAHHKSSVNVLMVYSTLFSLVVLPILAIFTWQDLFLSWEQVVTQIIGGILLTLSIYFYLVALSKGETSVVMPLALLVPVFGFIFSFFVLGEMLTIKQFLACLLIVGGALILSLEFEEEMKMKLKYNILGFMVLVAIFQAAQEILFKYVSIENSFVASFFWIHVGVTLCGLVLVVVWRDLSSQFVYSIKQNGGKMFSVNIVSEGVSVLAYMVRDYATLLAPIAIIMTLGGYQPLFVFALGTFLTIVAPQFVKEKIKPLHLLHKGTAIAIIFAGTLLIAQTLP